MPKRRLILVNAAQLYNYIAYNYLKLQRNETYLFISVDISHVLEMKILQSLLLHKCIVPVTTHLHHNAITLVSKLKERNSLEFQQ